MNDYTGWTTLFVVHTHYIILGMMFFLILGLISMNMNLKINRAVLFYNIGLNLTAIMLIVRGIIQVLDLNVISAFISGVASIGHTILGVSLILILVDIKKACIKKVFGWIFNPSFCWHHHIILILALFKVFIIIRVFSFLNFFLFQSSDYGILLK